MPRRGNPADDETARRHSRGVGSIDSAPARTWSTQVEDLSRELTLRRCARIDFAGAPRPSLGDYPLLARIGQGGMGIVYFAVHPRLETEVAIKLLPEEIHARQPEVLRRFVREARLAARLHSDHLVRVLDVDQDRTSGLYYLVMEYVRGMSAGKWSRSMAGAGGTGVREDLALAVCIAATRGLAAAHERGTIHRDVKPDNILLPSGTGGLLLEAAKLADLGLACLDDAGVPADERLTGAKVTLMGTPGFAAPEQLKEPTRAKKPADVFSMGATLYAFLNREGPFVRDSPMESVVATMTGKLRPISDFRADVTASTCALIDVCLSADPGRRYPDASALLEALLLCRASVGRGASRADDATTAVIHLAERSEVGEAVHDVESSARRVTSGTLRVEGGPAGAQLLLRRRGDAPLTYAATLDSDGRFERAHVEEGVYDLSATRPGFHPYAAAVEIIAGASNVTRLDMRERDGMLSVDSDPQGAEVALDGSPVGTTPIPGLALLPGTRSLTLSLPGHDRVARTIVVRGGATTQLGVIKLEPLGRLDLAGITGDVHFEIAGKAVTSGTELRPGKYRVRAGRDGFEPQEVEVVVTAGCAAAPALDAWRRQGWALVSDVERWDATTAADRRRVARTVASSLADFELRAMETFESGGERHEVAILVHRPTGLEFVLVPGGRCELGSPPDEPGRRPDERRGPATVPPVLMARTPVTQSAWEAVMRSSPSHFRGPSLPVESVTHTEAADFCGRVGLSLPTEAQWEFACRAGAASAWSFGDDPERLGEHAWFAGNAEGGPRPVGGRRPNAFGLFDVHGNVWEWCDGRYVEDASESEDGAATVAAAEDHAYRVFRGGGWADSPDSLRAARRAAFRPDYRFFDLGLRPVRQLTPDLVSGEAQVAAAEPEAPRAPLNRSTIILDEEYVSSAPVAAAASEVDILSDVVRWDAASSDERRRAAESIAARATEFALAGLSRFGAGDAEHEVAVFLHRPTDMEFVLVPATPRTDAFGGAAVDPFLAARTPTTQAAWRRTMGANPSCFVGERLPVEQVDLAGAESFCKRFGLELPSEAQWEHACRAGVAAPWCCGDEALLPQFAWFAANAAGSTHPVGEKKPNAFGLLDVVGNVWEWCRFERDATTREPRCRGGGWTSDARQLQSSWRLSYPPGTRMGILGFRPVRTLTRAPEALR